MDPMRQRQPRINFLGWLEHWLQAPDLQWVKQHVFSSKGCSWGSIRHEKTLGVHRTTILYLMFVLQFGSTILLGVERLGVSHQQLPKSGRGHSGPVRRRLGQESVRLFAQMRDVKVGPTVFSP